MFESKSRGLESGADDHDGSAEGNHLLAAERVSDPDGDDGAEEAAEIVRGDGDALVRGARGLFRGAQAWVLGVDVGELGEEDGQRQDTAHDTLICGK